jgi:hypothetical protein
MKEAQKTERDICYGKHDQVHDDENDKAKDAPYDNHFSLLF